MKSMISLIVLFLFACYWMEVRSLICSACGHEEAHRCVDEMRTSYEKCKPEEKCMNQTWNVNNTEVIQRRCMKIEKKSDANFTGCRPVMSKGVQKRRCWCNDDYCNDERLDPKTVKDRLKCFHCNEGYRACRIKELPAVVTCEPGEVCFRMTTENGEEYRFCKLKEKHMRFNMRYDGSLMLEGEERRISGTFDFCDKEFCNEMTADMKPPVEPEAPPNEGQSPQGVEGDTTTKRGSAVVAILGNILISVLFSMKF